MNIWIFRDNGLADNDDKYGGFEIVRETKARYYFENVCGNPLTTSSRLSDNKEKPGSAFNYHDTCWLTKVEARSRRIGIVGDFSAFASVVDSYKLSKMLIREARNTYDRTVKRLRAEFKHTTSHMMIND